MTTGNVRLQTLTNYTDLSGQGASGSAKEASSASFGDMISRASSPRVSTDQGTGDVKAPKGDSAEERFRKETKPGRAVKQGKEGAAEGGKGGKRVRETKGKDTVAKGQGPADQVTDEVTEALEEAAGKVRETVLEVLNISEEDLLNAMEVLGLTEIDLLNPETIPMLVTELSGAGDAAAVLMDESLSSAVMEIQGTQRTVTAELLQELDVTPEEFRKLLDTAAEAEAAAPEISMEEAGETDPRNQAEIGQEKQDNRKSFESMVTSEEDTAGTPAETVNRTSELLRPDRQPERNIEVTVEQEAEVREPMGVSRMRAQSQNAGEQQNQQMFAGQGGQPLAFEQNLVQSLDQAASGTTSDFLSSYDRVRDILDQVGNQIKLSFKAETTSMEMQLNPMNLGRVALHIESTGGAITAHFTAQTQAVKEALESQLVQLKENLEAQGLKVEEVQVTFASHAFEQNLMGGEPGRNQDFDGTEQSRRSARIRRINLGAEGIPGEDGEELPPMDEAEELNRRMMRENGNSVDYTA